MNSALIIGYIATCLGVCNSLPQIKRIIDNKSGDDLSYISLFLLVCALTLWLTYGILIDSFILVIANGISIFLQSLIIYLKFKYSSLWRNLFE